MAPTSRRARSKGPHVLARPWVAVDLGQAADYTAILVGQTYTTSERTYQRHKCEPNEEMVLERVIQSFRIVGAHRPSLGTSYPIIGAQIRAILDDMPDADLIVDATGVGRGVIDILRGLGLHPVAITITGGAEINKVSRWDIRVPKAELVSSLIAASQQGRLRIAPALPLRDVLTQEIAAFSPRHTATGLMAYEGKDGAHDDLVLAVAMGIFHQDQPRPKPMRSFRSNHMER